jgi:cell division protein FtsB
MSRFFTVRHVWLPATLVLYGLLAFSTIFDQRGLLHLWQLRQEQRALEARTFALLRENEELRNRLVRLETDEGFLEKVVREELGFVRKGELVYRFRNTRDTAAQ